MTAPEHSPLPWRTEADCIRDADGDIVEIYGHQGKKLRAHIVAAVNSHADLLAAEKMAIVRVPRTQGISDVARDHRAKFIIELDQQELAVRLLEAAGQMTRPLGMTNQECLSCATDEIRRELFRMSKAAIIWFGECCDKMERPS